MKEQPAFPIPGQTWSYGDGTFTDAPHLGMTLRDYFAAKAMAGWLASYGQDTAHPASTGHERTIAGFSYALADAMLAAREK